METGKLVLLGVIILALILIPSITFYISSKNSPKIVSKELKDSINKEIDYTKEKYNEKISC